MKKFLAYFFFVVATFAGCWFGILAVSTPYASPERKEFVFGLAVSSIVSIISAAYGNSLEWKKKREE